MEQLQKWISQNRAKLACSLIVKREKELMKLGMSARLFEDDNVKLYAGEKGKVTWCVWKTHRKRIKIFPAVVVEKRRVVKKKMWKIREVYQLKEDMTPELLKKKLLDVKTLEFARGISAKSLKFSASIK